MTIKSRLSHAIYGLARPVKEEPVFFIIVFFMLIQQPIEWLCIEYEGIFHQLCKFFQGLLIEAGVIYTAAAIIYRCHRKWVKCSMYAFFWILMAVTFFLAINFDMCISQQTLTVMAETNPKESNEFLDAYLFTTESIITYVADLLVIVLIVVAERYRDAFKAFLRRKLRSKWWDRAIGAVMGCGATLMAVCYVTLAFCSNSSSLDAWSETFPHDSLDPFSQTLHALNSLRAADNDVAMAEEQARGVYHSESSVTDSDSLTVVFVLGETYNKHHASLYGYQLPTTPCMERERDNGNLFVFDDAVCFENYTSIMEKNIFSLCSKCDGENWFEHPCFTTVFKRSGYDVWMWDMQRQFNAKRLYTITVNAFLYNPVIDSLSYTACNKKSYAHDKSLIDDFERNVKFTRKHNLVVFHLMGQHIEYTQRYPQWAAKFTAADIKRNDSYLTQDYKKLIATYDNATYYNDYVMGRIFDMYRNKNAVVVYTGDHGEEICDYRPYRGRKVGHNPTPEELKYQNEMPFVVWCSDAYINSHPDIVRRIKSSLKRPFMTDVVGHLLLSLGGVKTPYYRPEYDVISPQFKPGKRLVYGHNDYDEIMRGN